jgi:hypothetical protein
MVVCALLLRIKEKEGVPLALLAKNFGLLKTSMFLVWGG